VKIPQKYRLIIYKTRELGIEDEQAVRLIQVYKTNSGPNLVHMEIFWRRWNDPRLCKGLRHQNEECQEEINPEGRAEGKDVLEGLLPHNRPSGYSYLQGTLTASLRGKLVPIFRRISVVPPEKFEDLSTGRIIKQLIRVYVSDTGLQWAFRMMFLGSLCGLEPDETASLLDAEPVGQRVFDRFSRSFMDDYPARMDLLGEGGGSRSGSGGEFLINLAIERYEVLSLMVSLNSMAPFLTFFQVSMILRGRNEELISPARKALAKDLDRLKKALGTYWRYL